MKAFILVWFIWLSIADIPKAQSYLGNYTGHYVQGKAISVQAGPSGVRFIFYKPDILRVDFLRYLNTEMDSSFAVIQDTIENVDFSINDTNSTLEISSSQLTIHCQKEPLRISYLNASGRQILSEPSSGGPGITQEERLATFELTANDHFYGTGERGISLDLRGREFNSYNTQIFGYRDPPETMNINVPFLASTNGYALYFDNTYPGKFDLGRSAPEKFVYTASGGELSYYLIVAPTVGEQLKKYTWLTGRQPLPPRWAFGFIQSKFGYRDEDEARSIVATMRQKQIPCDAIILDLFWFEHMGDISWNFNSWPNPFQMMSDFLDEGFRTIVITEPYIVEFSSSFSAAAENGYLGHYSNGAPLLLNNWWTCNCDAGLLDISNPEAREWWWNKHPDFYGDQLAGIWTDLGEPERHPLEMQHHLGTTEKIHNIYNLLWAQTIFEGFSQFRPNQRLFNLTRSGFAGIQRYGVVAWSGDVSKSFDGLAGQIPMMLNMGLSGLAYQNSDIGGFCCGATSPELYVRWMQFGTFCPITRAHGTGQPTEPWSFGIEAETINKKFIELRYQLLPYIYTMAYQNYKTGLPLARPLFFEDPDDLRLLDDSSTYLWGDAFLVSPVVRAGQISKTVNLPRGIWIDYWTDEEYKGGQRVSVTTPLESMPLFVKKGSIIPMQSVMNHTNERPLDTLKLAIYPALDRKATFTLYEDDGETLAYQSGSFAQTRFAQELVPSGSNSSLVIDISPSQGAYTGKPLHRVYISEIHQIPNEPSSITKNDQAVPRKSSFEDLRQGGDGFYYDGQKRLLFVHTPTTVDSSYRLVVENVQLITSIDQQSTITPDDFRLEQNFPNPFNPTTTIQYHLATSSEVTLKIYDVLGREVITLIDGVKEAGNHKTEFDINSTGIDGIASGLYFYMLTATPFNDSAGTFSQTKKMLLLR